MSTPNLTQIDPYARRRRIPAAHEREPVGLGLELAEAVTEADEDQPDEDGCYNHPTHSYSDPSRPRWNLPLCLLEKVKPSKLRKWDAIEDGLEVAFRRIYIEKSTGTARWADVYDVRREAADDCADLTLDWLRELAGPGIYRVWVYNVSLEGEHRTPKQTKTRCFGVEPFARPSAATSAPQAPAAPVRAAMPVVLPTIPTAVPGLPPMPPAQTAQDWLAMAQMQAQIEQAKAQAEAAAVAAKERAEEEKVRRDEEREAREQRKRIADLEYRAALAKLEDEAAQRRRRDDDDASKQIMNLRSKIAELSTQQVGQQVQATKTPAEQIEEMASTLDRMEKTFGERAGKADAGPTAQVVSGLVSAVSSPQILGRIVEIAGTAVTNAQALAQMRMELDAMKAQHQPAATHDPRVQVQQIQVPPPPASTGPRVQAVPPPAPPPPEVVEEGDNCPDCGKAIGTCDHYELAPEAAEEPDDGCTQCPTCDHPDSDLDAEGDCRVCGPCTHLPKRVMTVPVAMASGSAAEQPQALPLPPLSSGGFVGLGGS